MAPKTPKAPRQPDTLTREELAQEYGYALKLIYSVPELTDLFERAVNAKQGQWTTQKFQAALQGTNWYQTNDRYFRAAWTAETLGGADWDTQVEGARMAVENRALELGASVTPEEVDALARRFLYEGWSEASRSGLLNKALSEKIQTVPQGSDFRGQAGNFIDELKATALANGLKYSNDWYGSAARSVASGLTTADDWQRDIRRQAAGMFPLYAQQIEAGMPATRIAEPYVNIYAQTFGFSPYDLDLNQPDIRKAMMNGTNLFDFSMELRKKPEWIKTKEGDDKVAEIGSELLRMFGLRG